MKLVVQDACVIIDLLEGALLELWPELGFETVTNNLVVSEISDPVQKKAFEKFSLKNGITIVDLNEENLFEISVLQREKARGLTLSDCSTLFLAIKKDAILLTSDGALRKVAERERLEVRGILWILDLLIKREAITSKDASHRLKLILDAGSRLPADECLKRFSLWSRGNKGSS